MNDDYFWGDKSLTLKLSGNEAFELYEALEFALKMYHLTYKEAKQRGDTENSLRCGEMASACEHLLAKLEAETDDDTGDETIH